LTELDLLNKQSRYVDFDWSEIAQMWALLLDFDLGFMWKYAYLTNLCILVSIKLIEYDS